MPGLPHRTGHGIGLDGHEWTNFVRGNKTPMAPGMCFSDEPMIAIYGEFGIRLEDCLYITEAGAKFFNFDPRTGARQLTVDLDLRGEKAMPGPCITCHGGRGDALVPDATGKLINQPSVGVFNSVLPARILALGARFEF